MTLHCREVQKSLRAFHAEQLADDACVAVETHLRHCAKCRSVARGQGLTTLLKAASRTPVPEPSDFFMTRLQRRFGGLSGTPSFCDNG